MSDSTYNKRIEAVSSLMSSDEVSPDETDPAVLSKYGEFARREFGVGEDEAGRLVSESLMYLKLHDTEMDPIPDGEKFGVGFS